MTYIKTRKHFTKLFKVMDRVPNPQVMETPEGKLLYAVTKQAVKDLASYKEQEGALKFLNSTTALKYMNLLGIEREYLFSMIHTYNDSINKFNEFDRWRNDNR